MECVRGRRTEKERGREAAGRSQEPPRSHPPPLHSPQDRQAAGADVLAAVLDTCYEVGHELLNGAFVLDGARDALCDLHLIPLAAWRAKRLSQAAPRPRGDHPAEGIPPARPPKAATPWVLSQMAQVLSQVHYLYPVPRFPEQDHGGRAPCGEVTGGVDAGGLRADVPGAGGRKQGT